jgi:GTPase SAR1 family protein
MALLIFGLDNETSFADVPEWIECVRRVSPSALILLCGNKLDRVDRRRITFEQGSARAQEYGIKYVEVSAKTGQGVQEAFEQLIQDFVERRHKDAVNSSVEAVQIDKRNPRRRKGCC